MSEDKKIGPFDLVDSASYTKEDLIESGATTESDYSPYLTNRALSYHPDSILHVNELNFYRDLPSRLQYDYLRLALRPKKRRSKWHKPENTEDVELVSQHMGLSKRKVREIMSLLPVGYVDIIRKSRETT